MSFFQKIFGRSTTPENVYVLTPMEFKSMIKGHDVQLVDVRTPLEYRRGHINNAINIDFYSTQFFKEMERLNKSEPVFLYCRSGVRSRKAAEKLALLNFSEIYDLQGGIMSWK